MSIKKENKEVEGILAFKIRDFLLRAGYEIKSFNPPGSQGGIILLDKYRGRGSIKPDVIALKNKKVILVEVKPQFDQKDIEKLNRLNMNHIKDLFSKLGLPSSWITSYKKFLIKAICIKTNKKEIGRLPIPKDFIVFAYSKKIIIPYRENKILDQI